MSAPRELRREAPAKLNLYLAVLGRRPDGYHELATVLQTIDLCDTVVVRLRPRDPGLPAGHADVRLTLEGEPALLAHVPTDGTNLATRAAGAVLAAAGATDRVGLDLVLHKRIPPGGGLGGGSSDAACVARAVDELLGDPLDGPALSALCSGLGSDVPFFLQGGTALCTGRGEHVLAVDPPAEQPVTLALTGVHLSTADVYRALDAPPLPVPPAPRRRRGELPAALRHVLDALAGAGADALRALHRNDLAAPARRLGPALDPLLADPRVHLAGSGSTLFHLGDTWPLAPVEGQSSCMCFVTTSTRNR